MKFKSKPGREPFEFSTTEKYAPERSLPGTSRRKPGPRGNPVFRRLFPVVPLLVSMSLAACRGTPHSERFPAGMEFEFVRGGVFEMGDDAEKGRFDEGPVHSVRVDDFYISVTEVTNGQYFEFLEMTQYEPVTEIVIEHMLDEFPETPLDFITVRRESAEYINAFREGTMAREHENLPVVKFCTADAEAFCSWIGGRLPTEAEWEFAARERGRLILYDDFVTSYLKRGIVHVKASEAKTLLPVKSRPRNSLGLYDMFGNAWEMCSDWYSVDYYRQCLEFGTVNNPRGPDRSSADSPSALPGLKAHVIRGGGYPHGLQECRTTYRNWAVEGRGFDDIGFRVVLDGEFQAGGSDSRSGR